MRLPLKLLMLTLRFHLKWEILLIGDNVDGWKLYPINVSDPDNLITDGTPISLTNTEKANFDSLSLSSSTTFTLGSIPFNAGFSNANLSLIGLQSSAMDLIMTYQFMVL